MVSPVTDPRIIEQLEANQSNAVSDPNLINALESGGKNIQQKPVNPAIRWLAEKLAPTSIGGWISNFNERPGGKFVNSLANTLEPVGTAAQNMGFGALESVPNMAISALNLPSALIGSDKRIPHLDLQKYGGQNAATPYFKGLGNILGSFGLGVPAVESIGSKIPYLKQALEYSPMTSPYLQAPVEALKGALGGLVFGENPEGGGRGVSSLLGAGFGALRGLSAGHAARRAGQKYENLFESAEKKGASSVNRLPDIKDLDYIKKYTKESEIKNLSKLYNLKNPSVSDLHKAQSDLTKIRLKIDKSIYNPESAPLYNAVKQAEKRLHGKMFETFLKSGNQKLSSQYENLTKHYAKDIVPYLENPLYSGKNALKLAGSLGAFKLGQSYLSNLAKD